MLSFKKEERLCSQKLIEQLFHKGSSFFSHPFKVIWLPATLTGSYPVQVVISVPKKRFKKAVDRNRIKRLIREAYRKNKAELLYSFMNEQGKSCALMIIYSSNDIFTASEIESKLINALIRLRKEYEQAGKSDTITTN